MVLNNPIPQYGDDRDEEDLHSRYRHLFSQAHFAFVDDIWDLRYRSTTAKGSVGKVRFHVFPDSMKNEVKEYIAFGILGEDLSNSWVHGTVAALKKATQLFVEIHGAHFSPLQLAQNDARL